MPVGVDEGHLGLSMKSPSLYGGRYDLLELADDFQGMIMFERPLQIYDGRKHEVENLAAWDTKTN